MSEPQEPCTLPKTPARTATLSVADTPAVHKYMHSAHPNLATEEHRKMLLKDLREVVPVIPADCFFGNGLLPDLRPGINVKKVVAKLVKNKIIYQSNGGRWAKFNSSSQFLEHEDEVFAAWPRIIDEIIGASGVNRSEATLTFECNPRGVLHSSTRDNKSKPDCVGRLSSASSKFGDRQWIEVAVPGEFKKEDNLDTLRDDATKVIWSMSHIMREDPRRRFVFGFTIEKWRMRLWLASRSDVLVSYALDIHKQHHRVVEFFLRIIFAQPHQLGWDDTIRRLPSEPQTPPRYDIDVNGKTYRTVRLLSNVGAEALRGRGTRVWEVRELSQNGEELDTPLVLKDSWVDSTRTREADVLRAIREASDSEKPELSKYYRTIIDASLFNTANYGDVKVCGKTDDTVTVIRRGLDLQQFKKTLAIKAEPLAHKTIVSRMPPVGMAPPPDKKQPSGLQYSAKVHHRVIFKEVGIRTTEVESLAKVFGYLCDVVIGLEALHALKWVHRDISIGNILVAEGVGMITDVEYAKSEDATTQHGMRTGTLFFMAVEVDEGRYLYRPVDTQETPEPSEDTKLASVMAIADFMVRKRQAGKGESELPGDPEPDVPPAIDLPEIPCTEEFFRHNPLHDLESVFWVALWLVLCSEFAKNDPTKTEEQWAGYMVAHGNFAADLFCDFNIRKDVMTSSSQYFLSHITNLLPQVQEILLLLNRVRTILITRYLKKEATLRTPNHQLDFSVAENLHPMICDVFRRIKANLEAKDLRVVIKQEDSIPVKLVKKRLRNKVENATTANEARTSSRAVAGGEPSRPAQSQKTSPNQIASLSSAPTLSHSRLTRSQTGSLPNRGSTSRSGHC